MQNNLTKAEKQELERLYAEHYEWEIESVIGTNEEGYGKFIKRDDIVSLELIGKFSYDVLCEVTFKDGKKEKYEFFFYDLKSNSEKFPHKWCKDFVERHKEQWQNLIRE